MIEIGDMQIVCKGSEIPPPKLVRALAVLGEHLHPAIDRSGFFKQGISKQSCILCSLIVRDFLFHLGFTDAEVASVTFLAIAARAGEVIHSLGIGAPETPDVANRWNGHLVVRMPTTGWLIDTTLYQAQRPVWAELAPMVAARLHEGQRRARGMRIISGFSGNRDDGTEIDVMWLDRPDNNSWRDAPDAMRGRRRRNRNIVIDRLIREFHGERLLPVVRMAV